MSITQRSIETGIHRSTLMRLRNQFRHGGFRALGRKQRSDKGCSDLDSNLSELVKAHLIALPHLSCATIQRMVVRICSRQGWTAPSYSAIHRIYKNLPQDLLTLSKDSAEYKRLYEIIHRFEATCPNEIWQADHNFMDIFIWDESGNALKPVITVILDDYSRAVTGYYLDFTPPSAQRTALALRKAIWHKDEPKWLACGIPDKLYTDRGADFISKRLQNISAELDFELIKGRPYHPQGKGKIERFFETMNQLFLCELPGYTSEGSSPQKPAMTLEQLRKVFHSWLTDEYMQRKNADTGQTPLLRWSQQINIPRIPESLERLNMLLMSIPEDRLVRKDGIHILTYCYFNTELQNGYMRESVQVRYDPSDVSRVYVFHKNNFICTAECDELSGTKPTLDVSEDASMVSAIETILSKSGRIDVLINNAGYGSYGSLEDTPLEEGKRQFDVNVFGLARLIQLVLPTMRNQGSGRIINVSSIGGKIGEPFGCWYHATKFAVEGLSDSLRMELQDLGIDVVVIEPGAIKTEWNAIAREALMKHSGKGPYKDYALAHAKMMAFADQGSMPSPPGVVAETIVKAALSHRPKTRYETGGGAKTILFLRRILSDRAFDAAMRLVAKRAQGITLEQKQHH